MRLVGGCGEQVCPGSFQTQLTPYKLPSVHLKGGRQVARMKLESPHLRDPRPVVAAWGQTDKDSALLSLPLRTMGRAAYLLEVSVL